MWCSKNMTVKFLFVNIKTHSSAGADPEFCNGGSWLMAMVYIVCSTMSMQSMLMLGGSGGMPPPGKFEKLDSQILNLVGFEHKSLTYI